MSGQRALGVYDRDSATKPESEVERLVVVYGMKRSGNHAIIQWIQAQGRFTFINNVIPIKPILRGEREVPRPRPFAAWIAEDGRADTIGDHPNFIASLEDHDIDVRPFDATPDNTVNVIVLRDPINLFASRIRHAKDRVDHPAYPTAPGPDVDRIVATWKSHAREFLGDTDRLGRKLAISYNAWFTSRRYRKALSDRLGVDHSDAGFEPVAAYGGGSSFSGTEISTNRSLGVLDRRDQLTGDEQRLLAVFLEDPELRELAERVERSVA